MPPRLSPGKNPYALFLHILVLALVTLVFTPSAYAQSCSSASPFSQSANVCELDPLGAQGFNIKFLTPADKGAVTHYEIVHDPDVGADTIAFQILADNDISEFSVPIAYTDYTDQEASLVEGNRRYCFYVNVVRQDHSKTQSNRLCGETSLYRVREVVTTTGEFITPPPLSIASNRESFKTNPAWRLWLHQKYADDQAQTSPLGQGLNVLVGDVDPVSGLRERLLNNFLNFPEGCINEFVESFIEESLTNKAADTISKAVTECIRDNVNQWVMGIAGTDEHMGVEEQFLLNCLSNALGKLSSDLLFSTPELAKSKVKFIARAGEACVKETLIVAVGADPILDWGDYTHSMVTTVALDAFFGTITSGVHVGTAVGFASGIGFILTTDLPTSHYMSDEEKMWHFLTEQLGNRSYLYPISASDPGRPVESYNALVLSQLCDVCVVENPTFQNSISLVKFLAEVPHIDPSITYAISDKLEPLLDRGSRYYPYKSWFDDISENDRKRLWHAQYFDLFGPFPTVAVEFVSKLVTYGGFPDPQCTFTWRPTTGIHCGSANVLRAPSQITTRVVDSDSIEVSWQAPSYIDSHFIVDVFEDGGSPTSYYQYVPPFFANGLEGQGLFLEHFLEPRMGALRINGLNPGTLVCVQVTAYSELNAQSSSPVPATISNNPSDGNCVVIEALDNDLLPPILPSLSAGSDAEHQLQLSWTDPGGQRDGFEVRFYKRSNGNLIWIGGDGLVGSGQTNYLKSNLLPNSEYCAQVRSTYGAYTSDWAPASAESLCRTTNSASSPPAVSSNVRLMTLIDGNLIGYWDDDSNEEEGYTLRLWQESVNGAVLNREIDVGPSLTRYTFSNLTLGTHYCLQVAAFRSDSGTSEFQPPSPVQFLNAAPNCAKTPQTDVPPSDVMDVQVSLDQVDAVKVNWTPTDENATAFRVNLYRAGEYENYKVTADWDPEVIFYNLDMDVEYCVQVRPVNRWGHGDWVPASPSEACIVTGSEITGNVADVAIAASNDSPYDAVTVTWSVPSGVTAHGFRIELWEGDRLISTRSPLEIGANRSSVEFKGLKNGKTYCTRVANFTVSGGLSEWTPSLNNEVCTTLEETGEVEMRFYARYYDNPELDGDPVYSRYENRIRHVWGWDNPPAEGMNSTSWSARWISSFDIEEAGNYLAVLRSDDGSRVFIDGEPVIDKWMQGDVEEWQSVYLSAGNHSIRAEYFQGPAYAEAQFWLGKRFSKPCNASPGLYCEHYFPNTQMVGAPVYSTTTSVIDYSWDTGESPLPDFQSDYFSILWTQTVSVSDADTYLFRGTGDDNVRIWLDNSLLMENLHNQGPGGATRFLNLGDYQLEIGYWEYAYAGWVQADFGRNVTPEQPTLQIPLEGGIWLRSPVYFVWTEPEDGRDGNGDVILYDLYLAEAGGVFNLVASGTSDNSYRYYDAVERMDYEWYVEARDAWGASSTSDIGSFRFQSLVANFEVVLATEGEAPFTVQFRDTSSYDTVTGKAWDFNGDGVTDSTQFNDPIYTYSEPGVYTVSLTLTNDTFSDTETKQDLIVVTAPAAPVVTADFVATPLEGRAPLVVNFTDLSSAENTSITQWAWDFNNDGIVDSTEQSPTHTYRDAGTPYTVRLTVSDSTVSSTETKTQYIQVNFIPYIQAMFSANTTEGAAPLTVRFTDQSLARYTELTSWQWDFDNDGSIDSTVQSPTFTYSAPGTYTVSLTISDGEFTDTETKTAYVTVVAAPNITPNFSSSVQIGVAPLAVTFYDRSIAENTTITSWQWDLNGDGIIDSTLQSPRYIYRTAGRYSVSLTVSDGVISRAHTRLSYIRVDDPAPAFRLEADFSARVVTFDERLLETSLKGISAVAPINDELIVAERIIAGRPPLTVQFYSRSVVEGGAIIAYEWDFNGDGVYDSKTMNPRYTYKTAGNYSVRLRVTAQDSKGNKLSDVALKKGYVVVFDRIIIPPIPKPGPGPIYE